MKTHIIIISEYIEGKKKGEKLKECKIENYGILNEKKKRKHRSNNLLLISKKKLIDDIF